MRVMLLGMMAVLTGCTSLSGYDGKTKFACAASEGVTCMSMTGVYENIDAGNLGQSKPRNLSKTNAKSAADRQVTDQTSTAPIGIAHQSLPSMTPIRTPVRQLRIWYAPWEDSDGDLNDQSYTYLVVDTGHWVMDRVEAAIVEHYQPAFEQSNQLIILPSTPQMNPRQDSSSLLKQPSATLGQKEKAMPTDSTPETVNHQNTFPKVTEIFKQMETHRATN